MDLVKKHVLMIDSRFRSSGTNEDFIHHLNENDFHSCRYVQLKDITFNNTIYNITTANNVLNWFTTINNTLTPGYLITNGVNITSGSGNDVITLGGGGSNTYSVNIYQTSATYAGTTTPTYTISISLTSIN